MQTQVRLATLDDMPAIIHLGRTTFVETYKGMGHRPAGLEEAFGHEKYCEEKLKPQFTSKSPEQPIFLLGLIDGAAAGFSILEFGEVPSCVENKNSALLAQIYVLKNFHGHGLGQMLFDESKQLAQQHGSTGLWLGVYDQNQSAIAFHKRMGFKTVGNVPWKFRYGEFEYEDNDLVMFQNI